MKDLFPDLKGEQSSNRTVNNPVYDEHLYNTVTSISQELPTIPSDSQEASPNNGCQRDEPNQLLSYNAHPYLVPYGADTTNNARSTTNISLPAKV